MKLKYKNVNKSVLLFLLLPITLFASAGEIEILTDGSRKMQEMKIGSTVVEFNPATHVNKKKLLPGTISFQLKNSFLKIFNIRPSNVVIVTTNDTITSFSFTITKETALKLQSTLTKKFSSTVPLNVADVYEWTINDCSFTMYETSLGYRCLYRKLNVPKTERVDPETIFSQLANH